MLRTPRERLPRPSARKNPITHAAASETSVSSSARSAPSRYGSEESASQKMWVSKLASTRDRGLLHVGHRDLVLQRDLPQRLVLLQRSDRRTKRRAELLVGRAVVDAERIRLGEEVGDCELARMLLLLEGAGCVLGENGIGTSDQQLRHRVRVAGVALEIHLSPAGRLELVVQRLEVLLVLRPRLDGDVLPGQVVRPLDPLRVAALNDERAMCLHVAH